MTVLVGITAQKGRGKSTLAQMLAQEIDGSVIIAFADALRHEVNAMVNYMLYVGKDSPRVPRQWLEDRKGSVFGPLLQGYGEFCRQWHGADYWIEEFWEDAQYEYAVIVPDVRHVNEAEFILGQGGLLIALEGPSRWENDQRDVGHPSERHVPECQALATYTVTNCGTLDDLRREACFIVGLVEKHGQALRDR